MNKIQFLDISDKAGTKVKVPSFGPVMLPLVGSMLWFLCVCYMILFKFQRGFNIAFVYLLISFPPFLYHSRGQVSIFASLCISIMLLWREGRLTSLLRLLLACEPCRPKYRRKANQYQSSSYRWDEVKSSSHQGGHACCSLKQLE